MYILAFNNHKIHFRKMKLFPFTEMSTTNYDFWSADGDIMADIFGSYNYGYNEYNQYTPKKCTITEITDDDFEDYFEEDDINVEELSKAFDNVIEDWKIKMEVIF